MWVLRMTHMTLPDGFQGHQGKLGHFELHKQALTKVRHIFYKVSDKTLASFVLVCAFVLSFFTVFGPNWLILLF